MLRKQFFITKRQNKEITRISRETEISFSEITRRLFDLFIDDEGVRNTILFRREPNEDIN